MKLKALTTIKHGGKKIAVDQTFEADDETAEALIADGAAEAAGKAVTKAEDDDPKPAHRGKL